MRTPDEKARQFFLEQLGSEQGEQLLSVLAAMSRTAHAVEPDNDEDDEFLQRMRLLGFVVEMLTGICSPNLRVIAAVLSAMTAQEHDHVGKTH